MTCSVNHKQVRELCKKGFCTVRRVGFGNDSVLTCGRWWIEMGEAWQVKCTDVTVDFRKCLMYLTSWQGGLPPPIRWQEKTICGQNATQCCWLVCTWIHAGKQMRLFSELDLDATENGIIRDRLGQKHHLTWDFTIQLIGSHNRWQLVRCFKAKGFIQRVLNFLGQKCLFAKVWSCYWANMD